MTNCVITTCLPAKKKRKRCDDVILQKRRHPDARFLTFWPRIQSFLSLRPPLYFNPRGLLDLRQREDLETEGGEPTRSLTQPAWRPHRQQGGTAGPPPPPTLMLTTSASKGTDRQTRRQRWRTGQVRSWLKSETRYDNPLYLSPLFRNKTE